MKVLIVLVALLTVAVAPLASGQDDRRAGDRQSQQLAEQAEELFQSALLLVNTKDWELARRRMQEATRLWTQTREPEQAAREILQMGDSYKHARNYIEALHWYKQALDVKLGSGWVKENAYNGIAQVYSELSENDLAKDYFAKAIAQARIIKDLSAELLALAGLADIHHRQGERDQAVACITRARQLNQMQRDDIIEAGLVHLTGQINQEAGRAELSKSAFEEALMIYRKTGNIEGQVKVLCSMISLSLLAPDKQAALDEAREAVDLAEGQVFSGSTNADKIRARDLRWRAWLSRARAERAAGQKELALKSYRKAFTHAEGIWWLDKISTEASAIAFRQETQEIYRDSADLLLEQGDVAKAYWWADVDKARAIRALTEGRRSAESTGHPDQPGSTGERSPSVAGLRTQLLSSRTSMDIDRLQKEIRGAQYALDEKRILGEMKDSRNLLRWSEPAAVKWVQEKMSQGKSALLEFLLGETRSFAWLITADGVTCEVLRSRKEIEQDVRQYLESLTKAPDHMHIERELAKAREQGSGLFSILFGNLARQLAPIRKLIVVPDGLLHYLPFETLIHDGRYLIEDHEISYNSSASMLGLWEDTSPKTAAGKKMDLLAFGDPSFEPRSSAGNLKKSVGDVSNMAQLMRSARGYALARLPRTRDEVQYVAGLFPPDRRRVYLGKESTEDAVKRESLRDYRRLHFATHSLIDEESPSRSAVALTLDDDPREDGFLEVAEISELDLDCDLVVLSACQTGRGKLFSGEGVVGLSRAFLRAGARSVVVSLWNVGDNPTSRLMKAFYRQLAADTGNAAALRGSKLQMIQDVSELKHPYYWGAFVLIGRP